MDTKLKIIIIVFLVVVLLYAVQFAMSYMGKKNKETFWAKEDVEHYEDPIVNRKSSADYELRGIIYDEIGKLDITDRVMKGKLNDYLTTSVIFNKLASMSPEDRSKFISDRYGELIGATSSLDASTPATDTTSATKVTTEQPSQAPSASVAVAAAAPTLSPGYKSASTLQSQSATQPAPMQTPVVDPAIQNMLKANSTARDSILQKTKDMMSQLQSIQSEIVDIQTNAHQINSSVPSQLSQSDEAPGSYKTPVLPPLPRAPVQPPQPSDTKTASAEPSADVIEQFVNGFENIRAYASFK